MSRFTGTMPSTYFDDLYAADADPWRFATSDYERRKYDATLAALAARRFRQGFEVGCSIGVLTRRVAEQCDALLAVDVADTALAEARRRCTDSPQVSFARMQVPDDWPAPDRRFDLILLSEVVYYLHPDDIRRLAERAEAALAPDGLLLLVHWTGETNYPVTGDEATDLFLAAVSPRLSSRSQQRTPEYRLELLARP